MPKFWNFLSSKSFVCDADEEEVRNLVVWLEDQRIRFYKIGEREQLRDIKSSRWLETLKKVQASLIDYMLLQLCSQPPL